MPSLFWEPLISLIDLGSEIFGHARENARFPDRRAIVSPFWVCIDPSQNILDWVVQEINVS